MPDPIDDGREALESVGPSRDLWADATTRAADGGSVPLAPLGKPARGGTWLAVAAAVALVAGTVGVLSMDDDASVDTAPSADEPAEVTVYAGRDGRCSFGVSGEPIVLAQGPADPPLFDTTGQPAGQTVTHATLGSQVAEIHVPGLMLVDLVGERVEDIQLERGTAQVWFSTEFVQVRWFSGSQDPCSSFTVTVAGGTEDGNRHAAVDLADRILLQDEISAQLPPGGDGVLASIEGAWQLERSTVDGDPTDGAGLGFTFAGGDATWTDGCNTFAGGYESVGSTGVRLGRVAFTDVTSSAIACPTNPTAVAVQSVMGAERIEISFDGDLLLLAANSSALTLRPTDGGGGPDVAHGYGIWPVTGPEALQGYLPEFTGTEEEIAVLFAQEVLGWDDVVVTDREPSEDGRFGGVFQLVSTSTGGQGSITVGPGDAPSHNVVYVVNLVGFARDPDSFASVSVNGTIGRADAGPAPGGTVSSTVTFTYGEYVHEGPAGEDIDLFDHTGEFAETIPGAVLITYRNGAGQIIGAWGRALPPGDFAAG